ncbi:hypothetical protein AKJ47_02605 [candidate division MSBL1 archaeon SCGC-AAA261G05]|uniref:HisA/hisF family protein n=2 Tax=candidate division MSBL1 TaxID=215777 RepID=A0A133V182_9EURY|nr:hypothetical protein AKJ42_01515 [candidate division MSBL1 archaeon SCGC-AAA261C02]KXB03246.1 hypothetical protein AKJ47_02605 [candidate division MSBL1 archaeon SCGC-AAA261G05]
MRIIPVIDLKNGLVVHAKAGEREKYEPIESHIADSPEPLSVALAFQNLGLEELYVADLDRISSNGDNLDILSQLTSRTRIRIMVDGGFRKASEVKPFVESGVARIVLATETLENFDEIRRIRDNYDLSLVGSIDMKGKRVVARSPRMRLPFSKLIQEFSDAKVEEIIILSLDRVGASVGPDEELLRKALEVTTTPLIVGGGIRNITDISELRDLGASGVLLATSLHEGEIGEEEISLL